MFSITQCPLCHSEVPDDTVYKDGIVQIKICPHCGFGFLAKQMTEKESDAFYKTEFQDKRRAISTYEEAVNRLQKKNSYAIKKTVLPFFQRALSASMNVLEVGGGWGTLSRVIQDGVGCHMTLLEPSHLAAHVARDFYHLDVVEATLKEFKAHNPARRFNAVILYHVFEHLADPHHALEELKQMLLPDGLLILALPNLARPNETLKDFFHLGHVSYFSPATLGRLLVEHGFSIVELEETENDLRCVARVGQEKNNALRVPELNPKTLQRRVRWYVLKRRVGGFIKHVVFRR